MYVRFVSWTPYWPTIGKLLRYSLNQTASPCNNRCLCWLWRQYAHLLWMPFKSDCSPWRHLWSSEADVPISHRLIDRFLIRKNNLLDKLHLDWCSRCRFIIFQWPFSPLPYWWANQDSWPLLWKQLREAYQLLHRWLSAFQGQKIISSISPI